MSPHKFDWRSSYDWWLLSMRLRRYYKGSVVWLEPIVLLLVGAWAARELWP
jgi:hypothetical protein